MPEPFDPLTAIVAHAVDRRSSVLPGVASCPRALTLPEGHDGIAVALAE